MKSRAGQVTLTILGTARPLALPGGCAKSILDYNDSFILELSQDFGRARAWRADSTTFSNAFYRTYRVRSRDTDGSGYAGPL